MLNDTLRVDVGLELIGDSGGKLKPLSNSSYPSYGKSLEESFTRSHLYSLQSVAYRARFLNDSNRERR